MRRVNLRDVPEDVYRALVHGAETNRQSLNAYVVERLTEAARMLSVSDHLASYPSPTGTGVTFEDATAAVREVRETS